MIKKVFLYFLCLYLFLSILGCDKESPTSPAISELLLPTVEYFTATPASIILDGSSTLSWSVANATSVSINPGIGVVSAVGTEDVSPNMTTEFTLTAQNNDGRKSMSCTVEIIKWAVLEYTTIPANPTFLYDAGLDETSSTFVAVLTETAGVGGQIDRILIRPCPDGVPQEFAGGIFDAFGSFSQCCAMVLSGQLTCFSVSWQGVDDNGYAIDEGIWFTIAWTSSGGSMSFLKTVKGANHHRLIR